MLETCSSEYALDPSNEGTATVYVARQMAVSQTTGDRSRVLNVMMDG
jgi:hypothetical protein